VLKLAVVLSPVVVAERCRDEAIVSGRPILESADPDPASRPAGAGVRSEERAAVIGVVALYDEVVHEHLHIREGDHERSGDQGRRDARQLLVREAWLRHPYRLQPSAENGPVLRTVGREAGVSIPGDCKLRHARGMVDRHVEADDPAVAVPICSIAITWNRSAKNGIHLSGIDPLPPWRSRSGGTTPWIS
jgi:hypothetical protein